MNICVVCPMKSLFKFIALVDEVVVTAVSTKPSFVTTFSGVISGESKVIALLNVVGKTTLLSIPIL